MKLSNLIISIFIIAVVTTTFGGVGVYHALREYNNFNSTTEQNTTIAILDKTDKLNNRTEDFQEALNFKPDGGIFSELDSLFTQGYTAMLVVGDTVDLTTTIIDESVDNNPLIDARLKAVFRTAGLGILLILLFVGIFLSTITKREQ